jgi:ADP-heptose:LPS heptosyltransferase
MCNIILLDSGRDVPGHARYWRVAEALGLSDPLRRALVPVTEADRAWARHALNGLPRPILAVHAGAGWPTKRWPAEKFAAVAARFPGAFVTIGSADERALAERVIASSGGAPARARCLAGATTTRRLAALLEAVDLVLSNDSGPMHLAAAMGTPVIGVFTCTSPYLSGPAGDHHELVATAVGCAASYCKRCPNWGRRQLMCLDELPVERVWNAVERSLAEIPAIARSA